MGTEDSKGILKNTDWKPVGGAVTSEPNGPITRKRLPKKLRPVPDYYFLPRRSLPSAIAIYGAICAAGVGAGMLMEVWINKKIKGAKLGNYLRKSSTTTGELWQVFFANPVDWWDHRKNKKNPKYPDFKHKHTGEALWVEAKYNPPGVKSQLARLG